MASIWDNFEALIKAGYPESTARKIVSGDLPMDYESRMARAAEQGFSDQVFHTGNLEGINEFEPGITLFASPDPAIAASYAQPGTLGYRLLVDPSDFATLDAKGADYGGVLANDGVMILDDGREIDASDVSRLFYSGDDYSDQFAKNSLSTDEAAQFAQNQGSDGVIFTNLYDLGDPNKYRDLATGLGRAKDNIDTGQNSGVVYGITAPYAVRSEKAAFDPDNLGEPYIMGAVESGSGPSLMDRATGAAATVGDIATQTWDDMSLLDKAALVTSPIPFVGAGTGIAADVMNMVNNPEERTFLNAALLASNFIPGNKIAGAGMAMAEAGKKNFRKIVDTFQKVPEADRDALTAAFNQVEARLDQLRAKDEALKSNAQRRDDRYSKPQNLSESELAEYNALMERSVNASMAGRMGKTSEEILKELRGE